MLITFSDLGSFISSEFDLVVLSDISLFTSLLLSKFSSIKKTIENVENDFVSPNNEDDIEPTVEMPPQRDIRETQPTISVNYRVVKNMDDNNLKKDRNYSNNADNKNDWDNVDNDW